MFIVGRVEYLIPSVRPKSKLSSNENLSSKPKATMKRRIILFPRKKTAHTIKAKKGACFRCKESRRSIDGIEIHISEFVDTSVSILDLAGKTGLAQSILTPYELLDTCRNLAYD